MELPEMNMHVPQNIESRLELEYLCRVPLQIISPQNNSPVMGINQDALVGAYLMTDDSVRLSRLQFMQLMLTNSNFDGVIPDPTRKDGLYTGKEALSMILPDFSANYGGVEIRDGVITKGRLAKKHLGESNDSIHHRLFNDYDADEALRFLDNEQQVVNSWLMNYNGFSVGVSDCILEDDARAAVTEAIETRLKDAFKLVNDAREGKLENKFLKTELEEFDEQLTLLLVKIREETKPDEKIRDPLNRFIAMQKAGSKGKLENLIQIMSCLGQQQVAVKQPSGVTKTQRIPYNYGKIRGGYDGRTLPHFHRHDDGPIARGFCKGSFLRGLNPHEFFFHNATGREGLIDTAIKSVTGDTPIVILEAGVPKRVAIGEWIDDHLELSKKHVEHHDELQMELLKLSTPTFIPTTDDHGNVTWGEVTAMTRHDPGKELYSIKTSGGRSVTVVESKSLIVWNEELEQFREIATPDLKVGDCLPVTLYLTRPPVTIDHVDMAAPGAMASDSTGDASLALDMDTGRFVGLFITGGIVCLHSDSMIVVSSDAETEVFVRGWLDRHGFVHRAEEPMKLVLLCGRSRMLLDFLNRFAGRWPYDRHVPGVAHCAPREFVVGLLSGCLAHCGTVTNEAISFEGLVPALAEGLAMLCTHIHVFGDISTEEDTDRCIPLVSQSLTIRGEWAALFASQVRAMDPVADEELHNMQFSLDSSCLADCNDVVLDPVVEITRLDAAEHPKVYDITVPSTLNFGLANGLQVRDTADTGYLQRRLIKLMEDGKIYYDGTVRTNSRLILQFAYGCDGMDPTKLEEDLECRVVYNMNDFDMQRIYKMSILADWETFVDADVQKELRADKDLEELLDDEFDRIYAGRDILRNEIFKYPVTPISLSSVQENVVSTYLPVNMKRLIENAVHKFRAQRPLTDLSPRYVIEEVERLVADITAVPGDASEYLQDVVSDNFVLPRIVIRLHLACKRVLTEYRLTRDMFDYVVLSVRTRYLTSAAPPGDMVGIIAAQSLGQPTTQMVLNSVEYGTELLLKVDGKLRRVKIGEYVDDKLAQLPEAQIERHPQDTLLGWTKDRDIEILSCDEDGKVDWQKVEAVTRHPVVNKDGSDTLLKVTLHSGREVTATKGKSFLKRQDNKIKPTLGEDLKVGDYLPVSNILPIPYRIDHLDLREYLPPTEWLYTSEVEKALEWRKGHGKFWWKGHGGTRFPGGIGTVFKLPYTRSDTFVEAFLGSPKLVPHRAKNCQPGCVYPATAAHQSAHIPEKMPLDEETGFLAGIYLAEGNCTYHHLMISNLDDDINERVHHCFKRWEVNYHIIDEARPMGWTKTLRSHSMVLTHLFLKLFGTGSHLKRIAPELLAAPDPFLKGLIGGYFDGDGCLTGRNIITAYSASHGMLEDLQQVLTRFGIRCSVRQMSEKAYAASLVRQPKAKRGWTLTINSAETTRFQRLFTMTIRTKQRALEGFNSKLAYGHLDIVPDVITETWGTKTIKRSAIKDLKYRASNPADLKVLQDIQAETIMYDRVMKIEEVSNAHNWVYDLTIKTTRSFNLWNGLCCWDTFHSAGILQEFNVVDGVPRLEELLSASKNPKAPTITIFLREEVAVDEERAQRVRDKLRQTSMSDLAIQSEIVYDPSDENSLVRGDIGFLKSYYTFMREEHCAHDSPWVLRIELSRAQLLERHIRMWEVEAKLLERFGSNLTCIFADDNADELTIRLRVTNDSTSQGSDSNRDDDVLYLLKQLETSVMKMVLRGVDNVAAAFLPARESRPRIRTVQGDGSMKSPEDKREVVIIAQQNAGAGSSSLLQILKMPEVDQYRTMTTNIRDVFELLGLEAARNVLMREILKVYSSAYINYRHIEMLIDTMTCTGEWIAMNRFGINHIQTSALSRASFEETENHFTNAAAFAEYDAMTGVSGACMCAQAFRGGTGECDVLLDEDMIREFAGDDDVEGEALTPIAEGDEDGAEEDLPDIGIDFSIDPDAQAPFAFTPGVTVTVV
ncbi:hypothetical protein CVIRNUC_003501 [Coccomyxa viridis]|uniref:DNA-directed RNA polymerase n=1 Tax=Coccomyxa viridis TaxID=1274662 RepID=A0AAV1I0G7_9CHLO|nr:hypothetical protein CVIRNUC_003501 [Coccomyxa viridis]